MSKRPSRRSPSSGESAAIAAPERSSPPALAAFRERVVRALDAGATVVHLDLDAAEVLDTALIATLISLLRAARERGARLALCASRKPITDTLRVTALDRIFTVEPPQRHAA